MKKSLDPTIMQSKTTGKICELVHDMQKEIKRLSLSNDRANDNTRVILKLSAFLLKTRASELARVGNYKRNKEFFDCGI
tara:strand:+ start:8752 stop:8988 length:237 start_codon:yes stop_codon:yes gene_type:complete